MPTTRTAYYGRALYADTPTALGQQLWLDTWKTIHSDIIRPGAGIEAKATIPEESFESADPNDFPRGNIGRAELNFYMVMEGEIADVNALIGEANVALSSNEVISWLNTDPA
jgi:hypothetical protein